MLTRISYELAHPAGMHNIGRDISESPQDDKNLFTWGTNSMDTKDKSLCLSSFTICKRSFFLKVPIENEGEKTDA